MDLYMLTWEQFLKLFLKLNYSVIPAVHLPMQGKKEPEGLKQLLEEPCFWMKSPTCLWVPRSNSFGFFKEIMATRVRRSSCIALRRRWEPRLMIHHLDQ